MRKILIGKSGKYALVDDEDFEKCKGCWRLSKGYVSRRIKNVNISMHRFVMNAKKGEIIDHINHDPLDNRKENLRLATISQNCMNRVLASNNTSGYKGVRMDTIRKKWKVQIWLNRKNIHVGYFKFIEEAVFAYNEAAKRYHGEFANLNIIA